MITLRPALLLAFACALLACAGCASTARVSGTSASVDVSSAVQPFAITSTAAPSDLVTATASTSVAPAPPVASTSAEVVTTSAAAPPVAPPAPAGATVYPNCAALNAVYPHGVGRTGAVDHVSSGKPVTDFTVDDVIYEANTGRDRDGDGIACEQH